MAEKFARKQQNYGEEKMIELWLNTYIGSDAYSMACYTFFISLSMIGLLILIRTMNKSMRWMQKDIERMDRETIHRRLG